LNHRDELKLVLTDEADYLWARQLLADKALGRPLSGAVLAGTCDVTGTTVGRLDIARPLAGAHAAANA
jgi:hypothetical protein